MLEGIAPGDYSFYAFDGVELGAWANADFMRPFEGRGRFVRVREGKNDALDVTVVSSR